ncbi:uncharacterized protein LOC115238173 [Formica exsecta]|uniref:uncharacterized protein LOC115238173 n=1 Tax=Formica exsecta TaxID=72781 RepID=UPI001144A3AB|nr:uncharacterized protein LOC115238173 [Formica exsecta]
MKKFFKSDTMKKETEDSFDLRSDKELCFLKELDMEAEMQTETFAKRMQADEDLLNFNQISAYCRSMNKNHYKLIPTPSEFSNLSWDYYEIENMKQNKIINSTKHFNDSNPIAPILTLSTPIISDDQGKTTDEKVMDHMDSADFISKSMSKDKLLQGQILAEYEVHRKVTECNYPFKAGVMSLPESSIMEPSHTESSHAESSFTNSFEPGIAPSNTPILQSKDTSVENFEVKESTDSTINIHDIGNISSTSISDSQPKTTNDEEIMDSMNSAELISTQMSKKVEVEDNEKKESTDLTTNIHDSVNISSTFISDSRPETTNDKEIMVSMKIYDNAQKDKKPEDIQDTKVKIHPKKCPSKCFIYLKCFIILLILILSLFLFQFYFRFGHMRMVKNGEHAITFATAICKFELKEKIFDHWIPLDQVLADDDACTKGKECNYLLKNEIMNLPGSPSELFPTESFGTESNATKVVRPKSSFTNPTELWIAPLNTPIHDYCLTSFVEDINIYDYVTELNLIEKEESKNYQNNEKENCQEIDKIPSLESADASVENLELHRMYLQI